VTDKSTEDEEGTDFAVTLFALNKGRTAEDLAEQLRELTKAVTITRKKGKLTLVLEVKPQAGVDGAVLVTAGVSTTKPKFDQPASIFFATDDGGLVRNDPTQQPLFTEITSSKESRK
jgi:hypothetical protein